MVASGCAPIGGYNPMWFDEHRGSILNGSLFIKQTVTYGMTPPLVPPPPIPGFPIEAIVLGLLATLGLGLALRHRRRK
jgi:MYXO-CTERM domain-containing protein